MSQNSGIALITIGGLVCMAAIAFVFIKTMINTANYAKIRNKHISNGKNRV